MVALFGFREREWRLMLDPAIIFFIAGLLGWRAASGGRSGRAALAGFLVSLLALVTMPAGNLPWRQSRHSDSCVESDGTYDITSVARAQSMLGSNRLIILAMLSTARQFVTWLRQSDPSHPDKKNAGHEPRRYR